MSDLVEVAILDITDIIEQNERGAGGHALQQRHVRPAQLVLCSRICADQVTGGPGVHAVSSRVLGNEGWNGVLAQAALDLYPAWIPLLQVSVAGLSRRINKIIKADHLHLGIDLQKDGC